MSDLSNKTYTMETEFELIAKTFQGLENVLAKELTDLGANNIQTGRRMVSFTGDKELMYRANFALRTAIRILKPIKHFKIEKSNYKCSSAFLRNVSMRAGIFYIIFDFISEFGKRIENRYKRPTIVMVNQVTNIFKENHFRFYCISNTCNFKEQITSWVFKTTLISHKGKTLAGEPRNQNISFRNSFCTDL